MNSSTISQEPSNDAIRQLYTTLAPRHIYTEADESEAQAILRGFDLRPSAARHYNIQRTADTIRQLSNDKKSQAFLQLATSLQSQRGFTKQNQTLFVLSQLSHLGEKRKSKRPAPLTSIHSLSTSTPSVTTPSSSSFSPRNTVVPLPSTFSTLQQRTQYPFTSQSIPRPLSLLDFLFFFSVSTLP